MRRLMLAAGVVCAAVAASQLAGAQVNTMPGQVVGSGYGTSMVGREVTKAAPPAGKPINLPADTPMVRRYDPNRPYDALKGTNLNKDMIAAPVGNPGNASLWNRMTTILGFKQQQQMRPAPKTSTYFPSLTRRNRERDESKKFRAD